MHAYPTGGERFVTLYDDVTERRHAEGLLRDSQNRQSFLLGLSDALRPLSDPVEIMGVVAERVGRRYAAGRCGYAEVPPPYTHLLQVNGRVRG